MHSDSGEWGDERGSNVYTRWRNHTEPGIQGRWENLHVLVLRRSGVIHFLYDKSAILFCGGWLARLDDHVHVYVYVYRKFMFQWCYWIIDCHSIWTVMAVTQATAVNGYFAISDSIGCFLFIYLFLFSNGIPLCQGSRDILVVWGGARTESALVKGVGIGNSDVRVYATKLQPNCHVNMYREHCFDYVYKTK